MRRFGFLLLIVFAVLAAGLAYRFWPHTPLPENLRADRLVVDKSERRLILYADGRAAKTYVVSLGRVPAGRKQRQGDGKTPEGKYIIDYRKPDSAYHRALHVSYPDRRDRRQAAARGENPGGAIMIHGLPNGLGWIGRFHRFIDWTEGCIAVTNEEMDELWRAVRNGTPIEIKS